MLSTLVNEVVCLKVPVRLADLRFGESRQSFAKSAPTLEAGVSAQMRSRSSREFSFVSRVRAALRADHAAAAAVERNQTCAFQNMPFATSLQGLTSSGTKVSMTSAVFARQAAPTSGSLGRIASSTIVLIELLGE